MSLQKCNLSDNSTDKPVLRIINISQKYYKDGLCNSYANELITIVKNKLNCSVIIQTTDSYGKKTSDGWTGIVGSLARNESDITLSGLSAIYERFFVTQFSPTIHYEYPITILGGRIYESRIEKSYQFVASFSSQVWFALILSVIFLAITKVLFDYKKWSKGLDIRIIMQLLCVSLLEYLRPILNQATKQNYNCIKLSKLKFMILFLFWLMVSTLLMHNFNVFLLTKMIQKPYSLIESLEDIVFWIKKRDLKVENVPIFLTYRLFSESDDERFSVIFKNFVNRTRTDNFEDIINGKSVFVTYNTMIERIADRYQSLGFHLGENRYFGTSSVFLYSKFISNSTKSTLDHIALTLFFFFFLMYWHSKRKFGDNINVKLTEKMDERKIKLENLVGVYLILSVGIIISLIDLIWEICHFERQYILFGNFMMKTVLLSCRLIIRYSINSMIFCRKQVLVLKHNKRKIYKI